MKEPLVTVYVTNYNYATYIRQSLDSLFNQTMQDFEVIIIDDGSTDNSRDIIEEYSEKARVVFQKNKGLNVSNNIALRMANGKYIMRLDADDYLDPKALETMSSVLESDDSLGLVFPDYEMVDKDGYLLSIQERHNFSKDVKIYDQPAHGACTMIRTEFLRSLGGYDERYRCQDGYELWIKFTAKYKVTNVNVPLFYYRQHGENLTSNEERILGTRMQIKSNFAKENLDAYTSVAILPIRGESKKSLHIANLIIGEESLLDRKINALLSSRVNKIIVTTSNEEVLQYVSKKHSSSDRILAISRPKELERANISLYETIKYIEAKHKLSDYSSVVIASVEFPLVSSAMIDDAINSLFIFKSDSVISVRPIENTIYQHDGEGMKPIVDPSKVARIEREEMYSYSGGLIAARMTSINKFCTLICGKVSHIVIPQKASYGVRNEIDSIVIEALLKQ